ncbi:hypothetical protein [Gemmiger sp.]
MKKKQWACGLLAVAMVGSVGMLSGCSSQSAESTAAGTTAASSAMFEVTLDPNGGAFPDGSTDPVTISVQDGTAIPFGDYALTQEGDTHIGWYYTDGRPWPGARKVTGNETLVAKWTKTVEKEVYPLVMTNSVGEEIPMQVDNGIYQFTVVSQIYLGYAQRMGTYTLALDELQAAIDADDGSTGKLLLRCASNYTDATGTLYAEFYNDGTYDLYYDYTNEGNRTKYCMETGTWTLDGYTAPITPDAIPEEDGATRHNGWDADYAQATAETAEAADYVTIPGEMFFEVDAENSDTMKLHFGTNGVATIYMTTYSADIDAKYLWSYNEKDGLVVKYNGGEDNVLVLDGDTATLTDTYENTYTFSAKELIAAIPERTELFTAKATNSETMQAVFYEDGGIMIQFDMTSYGMAGQFADVAPGQWAQGDDGLRLAVGGTEIEPDETSDGGEFTYDGNTYAITGDELARLQG